MSCYYIINFNDFVFNIWLNYSAECVIIQPNQIFSFLAKYQPNICCIPKFYYFTIIKSIDQTYNNLLVKGTVSFLHFWPVNFIINLEKIIVEIEIEAYTMCVYVHILYNLKINLKRNTIKKEYEQPKRSKMFKTK